MISVPHGLPLLRPSILGSGPLWGGLIDLKKPIRSSEDERCIQVHASRRPWGHSVNPEPGPLLSRELECSQTVCYFSSSWVSGFVACNLCFLFPGFGLCVLQSLTGSCICKQPSHNLPHACLPGHLRKECVAPAVAELEKTPC